VELRSIIIQYPENVILATDSDRRERAIAYHIATVFSLPVATTKRIVFNEITRPALTAAIGSPTTINQNCVKSQFAR
jgi:DNA topoisomerase-1